MWLVGIPSAGIKVMHPHALPRFMYLNAWSLVGSSVLEERLGGRALLEEVCHWGQGMLSGFKRLVPKPVTFPVTSHTLSASRLLIRV